MTHPRWEELQAATGQVIAGFTQNLRWVDDMKVIAGIVGVACGAVVGLALGVYGAVGLGFWNQFMHPKDPSAGSVAIVVIFTAPFGLAAGAALGFLAIQRRPRLFCATILPLAMLFVAMQGVSSTLRGMDRPRNFVLDVGGTAGAEYVGLISVDGNLQKQQGKLPAKFDLTGYRVEAAFALVQRDKKNQIRVNTSADNHDLKTRAEAETGVHQIFKSRGYSETFGGTSSIGSRLSEEEAHSLIHDDVMPKAIWEP